MKKKVLITYGTFDMFHVGHLKLLQRLSKLTDKLIVAVSSDEFNELKGKKVLIPYEQRAEIVKNIKVGQSELEIAIAGRDKMEREIAKTYPDAEYMDTWVWFQSGINTDGAHKPQQ